MAAAQLCDAQRLLASWKLLELRISEAWSGTSWPSHQECDGLAPYLSKLDASSKSGALP